MSQHDFNIANQSFPATRTDLNNALAALASNSSGDTEPGTTYANQWWYETDTNILKKYIKDISIKKHQSSQFITKAAFVLFHDSSIILDAIFLRKKIINLRSPLMGKYYEASNKKYSKSIKMPIIDMSQYQKINKKNLDKFFDNKNLYKNYLKNFLTFDLDKISKVKNKEKLKGSEQIITILNERFFKN